jgi:uptake hydrogenase large subunit
MTTKKKIQIYPLNRIEGDLEIFLEIENNVVRDAWSAGTMYRGIENIMVGRGPLDGLVITPRICGICTNSHLTAAAKALDMVFNASVPDSAKLVRNIAMIVEQLQNDMRHSFLLFMPDFTNKKYKNHDLYDDALRRYEPLKGKTAIQTVTETKRLLEIIAILGGQWPHSSFIVPGGVLSIASKSEIAQCGLLLTGYRKWYETHVLGCSLERFAEIKTKADLYDWLEESESHKTSEVGFFLRITKACQMEKLGCGHDTFISFGSLDMPEQTRLSPVKKGNTFFPAGFSKNSIISEFSQEKIVEDISSSWFEGRENTSHPFNGMTKPYATGGEKHKYTWSKAPRYNGLPAETGPLAEMIISSNPLFADLVQKDGPNIVNRQLARMTRPVLLIPLIDTWLKELALSNDNLYKSYKRVEQGEGFGLIQAPRGALGHWVKIKDGKINSYQIITPSTWNASPKDSQGIRGPWEEAVIGTQLQDADNPVEVDHIIRSFDPCLVCTVHTIDGKKRTVF